MKSYLKAFFLTLVTGIIVLLQSCELMNGIGPPPAVPDSTPSIRQGVYGHVEFWEGDFMPTYPPSSHRGTIRPVVRTFVVYTATRFDSVAHVGYSAFYSDIYTRRVATTTSNTLGFFQVELPPGKYSFFVIEDSLFYANGGDGEGFLCPVTVKQDSLSFLRFTITYKATF